MRRGKGKERRGEEGEGGEEKDGRMGWGGGRGRDVEREDDGIFYLPNNPHHYPKYIYRIFIDCKLGLILELYSTLNLLNLSRPIISPVEPVVVPVYKGWICFSFLVVWRFRILLQFRFKQQVFRFLKYKIENSFIYNSQKFGKIKNFKNIFWFN